MALIGAPPGVIEDLPPGVTLKRQARGKADVVVAFFVERAEFERRIGPLSAMIVPDGGLWVAWPKRSSGVPTTMSDHVVREVALPSGWWTTRSVPSTTPGPGCASSGASSVGRDAVS